MTITFPCTSCGKTYSVEDRMAGRQIKCRACESIVTIPGRATSSGTATIPRPPSSAKPELKSFGDSSENAKPVATAKPAAKPAPAPPPPPPVVQDEDNYALAADAWDDMPTTKPKADPVDAELPPPQFKPKKGGKKSSRQQKEEGKNPAALIGSIGAGVVAFVVMAWFTSGLFSKKEATPPPIALTTPTGSLAEHQRVTTEGIAAIDRLILSLGRIRPGMQPEVELPALSTALSEVGRLATQAQSLLALSVEDASKLDAEFGQSRQQALDRLKAECARVKTDPNLGNALFPIDQLTSPPG
jgi:DNA-directed RNA polymerase subunit RPC12/RpoP